MLFRQSVKYILSNNVRVCLLFSEKHKTQHFLRLIEAAKIRFATSTEQQLRPLWCFPTVMWSDVRDVAESETQALNKTARRAINPSPCLHVHLPVSGGAAHNTELRPQRPTATAINTANAAAL